MSERPNENKECRWKGIHVSTTKKRGRYGSVEVYDS
jgi:hypothetical protein